MSNETDKLASEMQKLCPSKSARESGLNAAMAAFSQEFAAETATETTLEKNSAKAESSEKLNKNSNPTQGLTDGSRPTGQTTKTVRVKTRRVETMTKLKNAFNFKPQTMMMAGTCSAALIAAMIVIPNMDELTQNVPPVTPTPVEVAQEVLKPVELKEIKPAEEMKSVVDDVIVVTGSRAATGKSDADKLVEADEIVVTGRRVELKQDIADAAAKAVDAIAAEDIGDLPALSIGEALGTQPETPVPANAQANQAVREFKAVLNQKDNIALFEAQQGAISQTPPPAPQAVSPQTLPPAPQVASQAALATRVKSNQKSVPSRPNRTEASPSGSAPTSSSLPEKFAGLTLEVAPAEFKTVTETIVVQEASTELVTIPAEYETVMETVIDRAASFELVVVPATYEWVDGEIDGTAVELDVKPAEFETVTETVVVQEASTELVTIPRTFETIQETVVVRPGYAAADGSAVPAVTKNISRRVVKTPASTQERTIPAVTKTQTRRVVKTPATAVERVVPLEKKDGKTRVVKTPAAIAERSIPAVTKQVARRVIKTPARTEERTIAATPQTIERQVIAVPSKLYLRDDDGNVVREFESRDAFENYKANLATSVAEKPVSTFSVDVDTASYSFLRASINRGQLPPRASIRLEEMINYFPYDYDAPKSADEPFKANVTVTTNPWNADTKLMHVGIKGYVPKDIEKPRSNLVFLIDTSGSMNQTNKLPLLINSFKLLLNTLDKDDTVSIVAYASASGTVLEPTRVKNKSEILAALNNLRAGGSTAGAAGLELAYQKAQESFDDEGVNRVILATDGDFNVGFSSPDDMKTFIQEKRETGIFLSVLGFGMGNYNDHLMQSLAQNGNGVAAYIDSLSEANKVLANEAGSALFTIAKDVKIQVEFNPATIAEYRLIGYETRALKRQDFNNDKVDAGEIGAGHSVTAIYEMTPVGSPAVTVDKLRYVSETPKTATGADEYAFVKIRHKLPDADTSTLQTFPVGKSVERKFKRAGDDMRFATAVAVVGQKLRGDVQLEGYSYEDAIKLAESAKGKDKDGYRAEFIQMVKLIETMGE